ncbi:DUF3800 domain-containing protein [Demequina rhizosphaerae]|uniref:DUF3800 domain-containing protein n=1 Tax=Demequina rhizosphaerae TaxID=1638985 RepID=UPI000783405D|nr:DUF3800 domain-containing protein [Demequina rhizosphaerae]
MWIFLDDSGDCGMKLSGGSSSHLVMAACVFDDRDHVEHALELVEEARMNTAPGGERYRVAKEFKYSSTKSSHKDRFFTTMSAAEFRVRAIILDKRLLWSERLLENPSHLKNELIYQLMSSHYDTLEGAKLVIDGQDTRAFDISDRDHFMARVNLRAPGTLIDVEFADSKRNGLVQLADMTAGAIRRYHESGDSKAQTHVETFRHRAYQRNGGTYWHFK